VQEGDGALYQNFAVNFQKNMLIRSKVWSI